jgi:nucleoside-diphosphate-sugar epimerase
MTFETVVVTGANGQVGRKLLPLLRPYCSRLIALVRTNQELAVDQVIPDWLNSVEAQTEIASSEVVIHLAGNLNPKDRDFVNANVKTTEKVISVINSKLIKRIIYLSYVGASVESKNAYLATKGQAEQLLEKTGFPVTIFRCGHIIGSPDYPGLTAQNLLAVDNKAVKVLGNGKQKVQPIYLEDVTSGIISALAQNKNGIFDLVGLETMTMDELVRLLNQREVKISHIPAWFARLLPLISRELSAPLIDVMLRDSLGNSVGFINNFDVSLTPLKNLWQKVNN